MDLGGSTGGGGWQMGFGRGEVGGGGGVSFVGWGGGMGSEKGGGEEMGFLLGVG